MKAILDQPGDWESLGKWMYDKLLVGRANVTEVTKREILNLVNGLTTMASPLISISELFMIP